jgi:ribonuclease E
MKRMLFNATYQEELRVATVEGQKLINFDIETTSKTQRRGNIYKGVVTRVEPSLEACFVDYGTDKQGFLPFKEIDPSYLPDTARHREFNRLAEGTPLIIQVEKDERGNKGAALTTYISLPGRYLVLMPNNSRSGGISRRIDGDERDELKNVLSVLTMPENMSIIARTAALGRFPEELQWDLDYLVKLWDAITTASANQGGSFLIYQESNLVVRSIRDHFSPDISEILIDTEEVYEQARQFISHVMPNFVSRVKLYNDNVPLFSRFQIEHQIETAYGRMVHLPSGGSIAIDHTEALTAIDVNSAKANKGSDIEATAFATNMEAAEEIARQLRLRDLGGLVVVDFIDMESQKNQREVENRFKQQLGFDRARIQMGKLSKFGLLELSRQRLQASLEESTTITCPRCDGVGSIRGTESTAVHILRIIQEDIVKNSGYVTALHVQLPVSVATYLLNEKRDDVAKIEHRMKIKIILIPNVHLETPHYKIRKITSDGSDALSNKMSYNLVETPDDSLQYQGGQNKAASSLSNNAVVKNIIAAKPAPVINKKAALKKMLVKFMDIFKPRAGTPKVASDKVVNSNRQASPITRHNKTRPVGVNRSNNKIQTVRQNNKNSNTAIEKNDNVVVSKPKGKYDNIVEQGKNFSAKNDNVAPTRPANKYDNVIPNKIKADIAPKPDTVKAVTNTTNVINQAWQPTPEATPEVAVAIKAPQKTITPVAPKPVAAKKTVKEEVLIIETKPAPVRINTITDPIDLSGFELVATDSSKAAIAHIEEKVSVKRYNDIERTEAVIANNIEYELVETKF